MLEKLSLEQEELMTAVKNEWINRLCDNVRTSEEDLVKAGKWLYSFCGMAEPEVIIVDNPKAAKEYARSRGVPASENVFSSYGDVSDYGWCSFYDYFTRIGVINHDGFNKFLEYLRCDIFATIQLSGLLIISRKPKTITRDEHGRLNNIYGPAVEFLDGYSQHYVRGVYFSPDEFDKFFILKDYSAADIINHPNSEKRAVLLQFAGYSVMRSLPGFVELENIEVAWQDSGKTVSYALFDFEYSGERLRGLKVEWFEKSGEKRETTLLVPRSDETDTVLKARAWTFGEEQTIFDEAEES